MNKICLLSDLHIEFGKYKHPFAEEAGDNTMILAGDIGVGAAHRAMVEKMCEHFRFVVLVLGNHEFYNNEVNEVKDRWAKIADGIDNFYLLDDTTAILDDVRFIGGTLWTDFDCYDWFTMQRAKEMMNDYHCVRLNPDYPEKTEVRKGFVGKRLHPNDTYQMFCDTVKFIEETLAVNHDGPTVIVTHHLPLTQCVHERYKNDALNGAYCSNLEYIFRDYDFDVWCHGHTHDTVNLPDIYGKRVFCNPRGYVPNNNNMLFDNAFNFDV